MTKKQLNHLSSDNKYQLFHDGLKKYLPEPTLDQIVVWLVEHQVSLKISRTRTSKLGDYRPPQRGYGHRISINHDLNPYMFFTVMVHELAHLVAFKAHGLNVNPHGKEWKGIYKQMLELFLNRELFPDKVEFALKKSIVNIKACADPVLMKVLREFDPPSDTILLARLPFGRLFEFQNRTFRKDDRFRRRLLCTDVNSKEQFVISPKAVVKPLE